MINDGSSLSRATTAAATAAHSDAFLPLFVWPTFTLSPSKSKQNKIVPKKFVKILVEKI